MMKISWYLGKAKCKLGYHATTTEAEILWSRDNPGYHGLRLRCTRCGKMIKEEHNESTAYSG